MKREPSIRSSTPSTRVPLKAPPPPASDASMRDDEDDDDNDSLPASDVGSFAADEVEGSPPPMEEEEEPDIPILESLSDGTTLLSSQSLGKELILPKGKEFKLNKVTNAENGLEDWVLLCTSHPESVPKRFCHKALASSRSQPIGTAKAAMKAKKEKLDSSPNSQNQKGLKAADEDAPSEKGEPKPGDTKTTPAVEGETIEKPEKEEPAAAGDARLGSKRKPDDREASDSVAVEQELANIEAELAKPKSKSMKKADSSKPAKGVVTVGIDDD